MEKEYMQKAVEEACVAVASGDGGPFGAVIVKDGKIFATGHNMVLRTNDCTAHAEITAIRNACSKAKNFDLKGCVLYTSCFPCPMCLGACLWSRLDSIYYGATADDAAKYGFDDRNFHDFLKNPKSDEHRKLEPFGVEEMLKPFEAWKVKVDKTPY
ncbi:unnamed protein product [Enterobius vermicularis]|uniref:CMP/dCMP-type deaminase domain-containing protein n=1 Tax=Enterobius vermicularis TaxID=51028 RepID=A0A0N4V9Y5_ENTVE|nr:unnamed protein product [Enterobius vermicularis]